MATHKVVQLDRGDAVIDARDDLQRNGRGIDMV